MIKRQKVFNRPPERIKFDSVSPHQREHIQSETANSLGKLSFPSTRPITRHGRLKLNIVFSSVF